VDKPSPQTWSQRFETALHPVIARFNASIGFDIQLIEYDLTGSQAHAKMLVKTGIFPRKKGKPWSMVWKPFARSIAGESSSQGIEAEDVHFAVERRLTELVGDVGKKLHTARSRNDQVGTDIRLYLRSQIEQIQEQLRQFQRSSAATGRKPC
jgi:argininosuccinate lyase